MKTTTKQTVSDKSTGYQATKPLVVTFSIYTGLFVAWLAMQLSK